MTNFVLSIYVFKLGVFFKYFILNWRWSLMKTDKRMTKNGFVKMMFLFQYLTLDYTFIPRKSDRSSY